MTKYSHAMQPVGAIADYVRGGVKAEDIDPNAGCILLKHMDSATGLVHPGSVKEEKLQSSKAEFQQGDVLYGRLRPELQKVCVAPIDGYCSPDVITLRPHNPKSSYYLAAILRSKTFTAEAIRLSNGAMLPRISVKDLLQIEIPWPDDEHLENLNELARQAHLLREDVYRMSATFEQFETSLWHQVSE